MAKYQKYAEYKDSEIVWMGNVPSHWTSERFKWLLTEKLKTSNCDLPAGSISFGEVVYKNEDNLSPDTKANYQEVLKDEFLINPLNLNYDLKSLRTALSKINVVVSTGYIVLHCNKSLDKKYVRWLLHEFDVSHMKTLGAGVRQTVNFSDIANCYFYLPTNIEQKKIGDFLDNETAKIDTLIAKQEKLIELLKEKRQAVISHAVTKGLNLNAPMKDSGVEWLEEVPEHWKVAPIKRIIHLMEQGKSPECENISATSEQWGVLKTSCVNNGIFHSQQNKALPEHIKPHIQYQVKAGDVLMSRASGSINLIGSVALVPNDVQENLLLSDKIFRIHLTKDCDSRFFTLLMATPYMRTLIERAISGAEGMANNITKTAILDFVSAIPPLKEQVELVDYLTQKIQVFDSLVVKASQAIEVMQERRTALISAAVTGKIDVRNWQNPNKNNEVNMELSA